MKILRLSNTCGSPCGGLDLLSVLSGSLPDEYLDRDGKRAYVISLRDEMRVTNLPDKEKVACLGAFCKSFDLGEAKALVAERTDGSGFRMVGISIESPNCSDFAALFKAVYRDWLGIPHEDIPVPKYRMREPSFVRGIRNDLRDLWQFIQNRYRRAHAMITG